MMDWRYVLDKYIDKRNVECPVLDAFVKRKIEIKDYENDSRKTEDYIQNWVKCHNKDVDSMGVEDWKDAWRDQYWHLFLSWFGIAHDIDFEAEPRQFISTELSIWLYEAQGLLKGKEKNMISVIETIDKLEGSRSEWRKKIFETAEIDKPSWGDLKVRANWT